MPSQVSSWRKKQLDANQQLREDAGVMREDTALALTRCGLPEGLKATSLKTLETAAAATAYACAALSQGQPYTPPRKLSGDAHAKGTSSPGAGPGGKVMSSIFTPFEVMDGLHANLLKQHMQEAVVRTPSMHSDGLSDALDNDEAPIPCARSLSTPA